MRKSGGLSSSPKSLSKSAPSVENKLDRVFSTYRRLLFADKNETGRCVTCGATMHWKYLQLGHYIGRGAEAVRWEENNGWPQCSVCNCNTINPGEPEKYAAFLDRQIGVEQREQIENYRTNFNIPTPHQKDQLLLSLKRKLRILRKERKSPDYVPPTLL